MSNQNVPAGERGPSYRDVVTHADYLKDKDGVGIRWTLVPPVRRLDGRGYSSWCVAVEVWTLRARRQHTWAAQAGFGYGGAWSTLPAALLATLRAYEAQREDERVAAEAQAAF
jgi:hypothetical protein